MELAVSTVGTKCYDVTSVWLVYCGNSVLLEDLGVYWRPGVY